MFDHFFAKANEWTDIAAGHSPPPLTLALTRSRTFLPLYPYFHLGPDTQFDLHSKPHLSRANPNLTLAFTGRTGMPLAHGEDWNVPRNFLCFADALQVNVRGMWPNLFRRHPSGCDHGLPTSYLSNCVRHSSPFTPGARWRCPRFVPRPKRSSTPRAVSGVSYITANCLSELITWATD